MTMLVGFLVVMACSAFYAGMNAKRYFYTASMWYDDEDEDSVKLFFRPNKLILYLAISFLVAVSWPVSLPGIGIYLLGTRFASK